MKDKREGMTLQEKNLLKANRELVENQKYYIRDILNLISYIKGNKDLQSEVDLIMKYYENKYLTFN